MEHNISVEDKIRIINERILYLSQKNELLNSEEIILRINALKFEAEALTNQV